MRKENNQALISQLKEMRELLDSAIRLAGDDSQPIEEAPRPTKNARAKIGPLDFDLPGRAFFNRYAQSLSGPEKFALVIAYLAKGDETKEISVSEIEKHWGTMTSFLGVFNRAHPTRAKDRDLVNAGKKGAYHLRPSWREIVR